MGPGTLRSQRRAAKVAPRILSADAEKKGRPLGSARGRMALESRLAGLYLLRDDVPVVVLDACSLARLMVSLAVLKPD